jgi:hypothetical protein
VVGSSSSDFNTVDSSRRKTCVRVKGSEWFADEVAAKGSELAVDGRFSELARDGGLVAVVELGSDLKVAGSSAFCNWRFELERDKRPAKAGKEGVEVPVVAVASSVLGRGPDSISRGDASRYGVAWRDGGLVVVAEVGSDVFCDLRLLLRLGAAFRSGVSG